MATDGEPASDPSPRRRIPRIASAPLLLYGLVLIGLASCISVPKPSSIPLSARLDDFPIAGHPLYGTVEIRFEEHGVPFITASDERDVPYALGMLHAHLRLAQLETLRAVAQARLSELVGPFTREIDHALRILDIDKAVPKIVETMPPKTKEWFDRYLLGLNHVRDSVEKLPPDFRWLGFDRERRWTIEDSLAVGRLASADINWAKWLRGITLSKEPQTEALTERLKEFHKEGTASFGPATPTPLDFLMHRTKSGSNCIVVGGDRTESGAAIIASDPHLGLPQPNLWLLAGYRAPDHAVVGMMLPGLPVFPLGRNESIAWGGTNMVGLSSTLYDVSELDPATFEERRETIGVRFWPDRGVTVRDTPVGPLLTDAPFFDKYDIPPLALKWRGHQPSDEVTAFLRVNRATNWSEFREAFSTYAVAGQNFLYADGEGSIGQILALEYDPASGRAALERFGDPTNPDHRWGNPISPPDMPQAFNPDEGFLISCNNTPVKSDPPIAISGNTNDRVDRFRDLLSARDDWTLETIGPVQRDSVSKSCLAAAAALVEVIGTPDDPELAASDFWRDLREWDGDYAIDSAGALAYQGMLPLIVEEYYTPLYGEAGGKFLASFQGLHRFLTDDLTAGNIDRALLLEAASEGREVHEKYGVWGEFHRVRIAHTLGAIPVFGGPFRFGDIPSPGSTSTIFKTAHRVNRKSHQATFGTQSRHLSDLSDVDENYFVLFGGQDGWLGSVNFIDQIPLWEKGEFIRMPLRPASVEKAFPIRIELEGAPPTAAASPAPSEAGR